MPLLRMDDDITHCKYMENQGADFNGFQHGVGRDSVIECSSCSRE